MESVRKTFFDPLATSKAQIRDILAELPIGSAHPFSPERVLLCRTDSGIDEIDISSYPEDFFFNAVDLGEMGEILLRRMAGFQSHLRVFEDFQIQQAPASTFKIPIVSGQITILAVSERTPTYYDFCFADASCNACCWLARNTFAGITHSGDILNGQDLLDFVTIHKDSLTEKEICVFISGYQSTQITRFLGTNPALLVANHVDKVLYIIPVPLDAATIGDATICCPLVVKRDGDSLVCSILPTATTDRGMMCHSSKLISPAFPEAIKRADFTISVPEPTVTRAPKNYSDKEDSSLKSETLLKITGKENAVISTNSATFPSFLSFENTQIIRFGTGIEFEMKKGGPTEAQQSAVVLPCIFGSQLQGPVLLATGTTPLNIPFLDEVALRGYYEQLKDIVVIVDDRMTDNARNLATAYRINALFILQLNPENEPKSTEDVLSLLNSANINAVTALAGPQSLVLIQIFDKYYFYRGLANRAHLNTFGLAFGSDVTSIIESVSTKSLIDPRVKRIVNLDDSNTIILPISGEFLRPQDLQRVFEELPVEKVQNMEEDIAAAVPQLQLLLNQTDLQELSKALVSALSAKVSNVTAPLRDAYVTFLAREYKAEDPESVKIKNQLLGNLRKTTKELQKALEPAISNLANMMSSQTTSKRTHDLKRLVRQAQIQGNIEAVKTMTFDTLAGYLETYAADMGVMLLNIETVPYRQLLGNLKNAAIDVRACCELDSRVLYLEGFDAGIIIEQSQNNHDGPLRSQAGPSQPILAVPYLNQGKGNGSMLAWVCWDEFVNLESPYTVRWMEKCNEAHIAALRIMMRSTLSQAVASREHDIQPGSPETGHLMSALLMAAMSKLAAMRTTAPVVSDKAEDTVTRLMRGLFGNLLTIAGSGVRPLSMVWQLFGLNPQYDIPTNHVDWIWYETVVALYPYTGWPLKQFYGNLEKLLDKAIIRVVTKNENVAQIKESRTAEMIKYCKLRNIELDHSRTIITIFMRMLTTENVDLAAVAARLLEQLPRKLERQTKSYTRMINYLEHLAKGGQQRVTDDLIAASVYTKRSAAFSELKNKVSEMCITNDWVGAKESCQALIDKHAQVAAFWHVPPGSLSIQNMKAYRDVLDADFGDDIDQETAMKNHQLTRQVLGDAERNRVPWQVGKAGQFGDDIEPLDEAFLHEVLTGERTESVAVIDSDTKSITMKTSVIAQSMNDEFSEFGSSLQARFISTMQRDLSAEDVCDIVKVPVSAMRVFIKALKPEFVWEDLGQNFKVVILGLLKERSNRAESRPVKKLLDMEIEGKILQIEG
ncbi:hypothetical protein BGW36DRAFT_391578 [Talaromyces proteolyticus]|uniref:Uncharacterized protein n=1 Tax=Talaromyces proteolyticus TaxID=1131652 RepID=A0AAD4PRJ7_9EURO|nr:uncharacterized protein BGW36DRAFT_391578 [Talaromyces proteolyticus]KAH8689027.1 hypothetical protein BGW36DRAFT_391578 [Talaromyces proteolyticus]